MKIITSRLALTILLLAFSSFTLQKSGNNKMLMEQVCDSSPLLKETLMQAGLSGILMDNGPYTFFAPADAALLKYKNSDPGKLKNVLMNHLVVGRMQQEDFKDGSKLTTLGGKEISVIRKGNQLLLNGVLLTGSDSAKNGMMHRVENWLVSPN